MSEPVLADAQFGIARILRPVSGFEATYEGFSAALPVYMFEGNNSIDPLALDGTPGYDPTLARGLSVPLGARVLLWIPNVFYTDTEIAPVTSGYEWTIIWRLRNLFDFRQKRTPYHLSKQGSGPLDTTAPVGQQDRVVIPAAYNTITYIQVEPSTQLGRAIQNVHAEDLEMAQTVLSGPLLPGGAEQAVEQGITDPAVIPEGIRPQFLVHEVQALGDEMLICARREVNSVPNWDFASTDLRFSRFLGNATGQEFPDVGVYVSVGSAP